VARLEAAMREADKRRNEELIQWDQHRRRKQSAVEEDIAARGKHCEDKLVGVERMLVEKDAECRVKIEAVQFELTMALDRHHEELTRRGEAHAEELVRLEAEYKGRGGPDSPKKDTPEFQRTAVLPEQPMRVVDLASPLHPTGIHTAVQVQAHHAAVDEVKRNSKWNRKILSVCGPEHQTLQQTAELTREAKKSGWSQVRLQQEVEAAKEEARNEFEIKSGAEAAELTISKHPVDLVPVGEEVTSARQAAPKKFLKVKALKAAQMAAAVAEEEAHVQQAGVEKERKAIEGMKDGPKKLLRTKALKAAQMAADSKAEEAEAKRSAALLEEEEEESSETEPAQPEMTGKKLPLFDQKWQEPKAAPMSTPTASWAQMRERHITNAINMKKAAISKHLPSSVPSAEETTTPTPPEASPDSYDAAVVESKALQKRAVREARLEQHKPKAESTEARSALNSEQARRTLSNGPRGASAAKPPAGDSRMAEVRELQSQMESRLRGIGSRLNRLSDDRPASASDPTAAPRKAWFHNKGKGLPRAPIRNPEAAGGGQAQLDDSSAGPEMDEMVQAMASLLEHSDEFKHRNF